MSECVKCGSEKIVGKNCRSCAANYYRNNREKLLAKQKQYALTNSKEVSEYKKNYCYNNKDKVAKSNKLYYNSNKEKCNAINNRNYVRKYNSDPIFKLRRRCHQMIGSALKGNKFGLSISKYLPYSMIELKEHLEKQFEPWMNWNNHGSVKSDHKTWQIDHIIPQSKFPYTYMSDDNFKKCWALENLQPLEAIANIKKSNK